MESVSDSSVPVISKNIDVTSSENTNDGENSSITGQLIHAPGGESDDIHEVISVDISAASLLSEPMRSEAMMRYGRDSPLGQFNESDDDSQLL